MGRSLRSEHGATLVEYALLVALVASVSTAGVQAVRTGASSTMESVKSDIELGASQTSITSATTAATTTTAAASPTTTAATTTTTTTTAPTTTTTAATNGGALFGVVTTTVNSTSSWSAQTTVAIRNNVGQVVAGATVTVTLRYPVVFYGQTYYQEDTKTVITGADGNASISAGPYGRASSYLPVSGVEFKVTGATLPGGLAWDGNQASASANAP